MEKFKHTFRFAALVVFLLTYTVSFAQHQSVKENDLQKDGLHGKVKAVYSYSHEAYKDDDGSIKQKHDKSLYLREYFYNEEGWTTLARYQGGGIAVTSEFTYDSRGNKAKIVSYNAEMQAYYVVEFTYDHLDRLINQRSININPDDETAPQEIYPEIIYRYGDRGNLVEKTVIEIKDTTRYKFDYRYDQTGEKLLTKTTLAKSPDSSQYTVYNTATYQYNPDGSLLSRLEIDQDNCQYHYDSQERLVMTEYLGAGGRQYQYNENGHLTRESDPSEGYSVEIEYQYDDQKNWVKRIIHRVSEVGKFSPYLIDTRLIEYYE